MSDLVKEYVNPVYLIEFIYVSGAKVRYWLTEFVIDNGSAKWTTPSNRCKAMYINMDNVESIHQLDIKELEELRDPTDTRLSWER